MRRSRELDNSGFELRRLREELYRSRRAILDLMPEEMEQLLTSFYQCASRPETYEWADEVAYKIIDLIPEETTEVTHFREMRANCPLCGQGSQGPFDEGYKLPEGMRRHLTGYGNARQCEVMYAAEALARDYWYDKFHEEELAEEIERLAARERRRTSEVLYRIRPDGQPQLIDEGIWLSDGVRDEQSLEWAEQRLESIGFTLHSDGNVKSYTREVDGVMVYADPRQVGRIDFSLHRSQAKRSGRNFKPRFAPTFYILDQWKNDLPGKFMIRVRQATERLRD